MTKLNRSQKKAGAKICKREGRHQIPSGSRTCRRCNYKLPRRNWDTWGRSIAYVRAHPRPRRQIPRLIPKWSFRTPSLWYRFKAWIRNLFDLQERKRRRDYKAARAELKRLGIDKPRDRGSAETWYPRQGGRRS